MDNKPPQYAPAPTQAMVAPPAYPPPAYSPGYPVLTAPGMQPQVPQYPVSSPMTSVTNDGTTTTAIMVQQPTVVQTIISFGPYPAAITCPHCHASIVTAISYSEGLLVWLMVGMLCIVGLWLGCCLIPLCVPGLKDVTHSCPSCNAVLGHHKRM